jgi:hypothetical protein
MQRICRSVIGLALLATPLIACGGDDDGGNSTPDAKVFMDAAIDSPPACSLAMTLPGGTFGTTANRPSFNWISKSTQGVTSFRVSIPLDAGNKNFVTYAVIKSGASWTVNTPINFEPNPKSTTAAAAAFVAENVNTTTGMGEKYYWASSGSITLTAIAQTAGAPIDFTGTAANFRAINVMTGDDIPGGCTTMVGMWEGHVAQKDAVQAAIVTPIELTTDDWRSELLRQPILRADTK